MKTTVWFYLAIVLLFYGASADPLKNSDLSSFKSELSATIMLFDSAYAVWAEDRFMTVADKFGNMSTSYPEEHLPYYWQAVVRFHLVSYTFFGLPEHRDRKAAKKYVDRALDALDAARAKKPGDAESLALYGTLTGVKILLKPLSAPVLGPKVMSSIKEAIAADSTNPRVNYLVGVSYFYTPALMGGGVDKALDYLQKAAIFYRNEADEPVDARKPRWGRSTCLGFIGKAYAKKKDYDNARIWYEKALKVNPADKMVALGLQELQKKLQ